MPAVLVVIPARGGSKAIPRKNLRALGGRPLLAYAIETANASRYKPRVVVSSDDDEVLALAQKLGAEPRRRDAVLAGDAATLDSVVGQTVDELTGGRVEFDVIVTLQPTSPLLSVATLDEAIARLLAEPTLDTLLSAVDDTHLTWRVQNGRFEPNYTARLNRQYLEPVYRETGGLIICRPSTLATGSRIGRSVSLLVLSGAEAIDIDTREDWALCEWYLSHRDVLFVVAGYPEIGLGHVYNTLTIANELVRHRVRFLVTRRSILAQELLAAHNYEVHRQESDDIVDDILRLAPDVVINDRLDTEHAEIRRLRQAGKVVVSFEDLGPGAAQADLVINAIYPEREQLPNHYFGARYFCLRHEFALTPSRTVCDRVNEVLVTFGGVDPNNLTARVLEAIHDECSARDIKLSVVAGRGYHAYDSLRPFANAAVHRGVVDMADRIRAADLVFTSAGRTVFEVASIGTPAVVLAQNDRELTHFFAAKEHGFVNLGLGRSVSRDEIKRAFVDLLDNPAERRQMQRRMLSHDLRTGTARVVRLIERVLESDGAR